MTCAEMNCRETQESLSAYHDGELSAVEQGAAKAHLEHCSTCAAILQHMVRLSQAAASLPEPAVPPSIWRGIERAGASVGRSRSATAGRSEPSYRSELFAAAVGIAAVIAIGVFYLQHRGRTNKDALAAYWQAFDENPRAAQKQLLAQYSGQPVSESTALRLVGYRPIVSDERLPEAVAIETSYVLDMPCCRCLQTVCVRNDGTVVAVFEHRDRQPGWFAGRPQKDLVFEQMSCRVAQLPSNLAATWTTGSRTITIVGLRSADEVRQWMNALNVAATDGRGPDE